MEEQVKFYKTLYRNCDEEVGDVWPDKLMQNRPQLTEEQREEMEGPLTYNELSATVKSMANNKSPGTDGFTVEFFKFFWPDVGKIILKGLNEAYEDKELSAVQKQGIITCIPKEDLDRTLLKNGVQLLCFNVIYKMAFGCIANRIKKFITVLIGDEQKGFIKG